jgi:hypothetical protein
MEIIFIIIGLWLFGAALRRVSKTPAHDWKTFERNRKKLAPEQRDYDNYLAALPELRGDGTFSQEIVGEQAYRETLEQFGAFLAKYHPGENEILVLVELEPDNEYDSNAVRVEAGQATIGYIPRMQAEAFGEELSAIGGRATATARFYYSSGDGLHSITLDLVRPLTRA